MIAKAPSIEEISWEYLNCFNFVIYPDNLLVITNAERKDLDKAIEKLGEMSEQGEHQNIDMVLHEMGFAAVVCMKPAEMVPIMF